MIFTRSFFVGLCVLGVVSTPFALYFGSADLDMLRILQCSLNDCDEDINQLIFWEIRLPRVLAGFLVGGALSIAGATLQNVTRNRLADPYLFGVAAGAGLGAAVATILFNGHLGAILGLPEAYYSIALPISALIGALFAVLLVQAIFMTTFARRTENMLLAGVAVTFMLSACSQFILYISEPFAANQVIFWMMGSLARAEMNYVLFLTIIVFIVICFLFIYAKRLDALLLGDDKARTLGVNVKQLRIASLFACAALTAGVVAYCGGIGFVGLMIPHIVRSWFGSTIKALVFWAFCLGGTFLVWVDVFARSAISEQEIPIGIITSALGSVFFLLAMRRTHAN